MKRKLTRKLTSADTLVPTDRAPNNVSAPSPNNADVDILPQQGSPQQDQNMFSEYGLSGLKRSAGFVLDEFFDDLRGYKGIKIFREMRDNSAVVGASLRAIEMAMRQVDWKVEPGEDDSEGQELADFIQTCLNDMSNSWEDTLSEISTMLTFGHSFHEVVYKVRGGDSDDPTKRSRYDDGRIGWRKIALRAQETLHRWEFDAEGGIQGMYQIAAPDYRMRFIPIDKALLFRTTVEKNNPEGRSVLRTAYFSWYFAKRLQEIEAIGIERDLNGLPVAYVPYNIMLRTATEGQKAMLTQIKTILRDVRRDEQEGVILPTSYDEKGNPEYKLELLSAPSTREMKTNDVIQRYNLQIATSLMTDFLSLGHDAVGSRALADPKIDFFLMSLNALLDAIAEVFNRYGIPRLLDANGLTVESPPRLVHSEAKSPKLEVVGAYIANLSKAGMPLFPQEDLQKHLLGLANLPNENVSVDAPKPDPDPLATGSDPLNPAQGDPEGLGQTEEEDEDLDEFVDDERKPPEGDGRGRKPPKPPKRTPPKPRRDASRRRPPSKA